MQRGSAQNTRPHYTISTFPVRRTDRQAVPFLLEHPVRRKGVTEKILILSMRLH